MTHEAPPDMGGPPPDNDDFSEERGGPPDGPFALALRKPAALAVETQTDAFAAAAAREVEARIAAARRWPREIELVEKRLLADCARPGFAVASRYARPVGGDCKTCEGRTKTADGRSCEACLGTGKMHAHGFSIRFAEAAYQALGNIDVASIPIYSDNNVTVLRCQAVDLETNSSWKVDVSVPKTVERRKLKKGQRAIDTRQNSWGDTVYIVPADPAEHEKDCGAIGSKKIRDLILRLLPADVKEACEAQVKATMTDQFRKQAAAVVAKLCDSFAKLKPPVAKDAIAAYLGHALEQLTEDEYLSLRAIFMGISEGHTTWANLVAEKRGDVEQPAGAKSTVDDLRDTLTKRAEERKKKADAAAAKGNGGGEQGAPQDSQGTAGGAQQPAASQGAPAQPQGEQREPGSDG